MTHPLDLVLTLVSRDGGVSGLASAALGRTGGVKDRSAAGWSVAETGVAGGPDLVAWLEAETPARGADWAITPAANRRKRLLISDMDSTIIGQECLDELADFAGLKAEVSAITERAMRGELDFAGALTQRVASSPPTPPAPCMLPLRSNPQVKVSCRVVLSYSAMRFQPS